MSAPTTDTPNPETATLDAPAPTAPERPACRLVEPTDADRAAAIRKLRTAAGAAGDTGMVATCDLALAGDADAAVTCFDAIADAQAAAFDSPAAAALRSFAFSNYEVAFAHMVTAAIEGEAWAVERIEDAFARIGAGAFEAGADIHALKLRVISTTETDRPDGYTAKSFVDTGIG